MNKEIIFAIFGDGKFISWTYGLFMQLTTYPKVYNESDRQIEVVLSNFKSKIRRLQEVSNFNDKVEGLDIIDNSQNKEKEILSKYTNFELKMYYLENSDLEAVDLDKPVKTFIYQ